MVIYLVLSLIDKTIDCRIQEYVKSIKLYIGYYGNFIYIIIGS